MIPPEVTELKDALRVTLTAIGTTAHDLHGTARMNGNGYHTGVSWRKCKGYSCKRAQELVERFDLLATPANHNEHALRNWRRTHRQVNVEILRRHNKVMNEQ